MEAIETQSNINVYAVLDIIKALWLYLLRRLWIPVILMVFFGWLFYRSEIKKPTLFVAVNTFMLEDEIMGDIQTPAGGGVLSILQGKGTAGNKAVMVEMALSSMLFEKTLLASGMINGKWQSLGNYYLDITGRGKQLKGDPKFKSFNLDSTYKYGVRPDYDFLLRQLALTIKPSLTSKVKESGLIEHVFTFWNEEFARVFAAEHIRQISDFYIDRRMEKAATFLVFTKRRVDSLRNALSGQEYGLAGFRDVSFGTVMTRAKVPELTYNRNINLLNIQYGEAIAAFNLAKYEYEKRKPLISIVDDARSPLSSINTRPVFKTGIGCVIGFVSGVLLVIGYYFGAAFLKKQKTDFYESQVSTT